MTNYKNRLKKLFRDKSEEIKKKEKINLYCEKCENSIMLPQELPNDKELIRILKEDMKIKRWIPLKTFKKLYILFKCPKCGWKKFSKIEELIIQGFIDINICGNCDIESCKWTECTEGGFIYNKEEL